ncbi:PqqD family protein [Streptomyces sp. NBC_01198]|uniref:PqqD family protein n=1 Tax=Streptomyces sp. NBC_01198 TaxID=2903769 RepID=UPI002E144EF9|nr:PqqD family protein [Streptomyces sp. NBC_01198]
MSTPATEDRTVRLRPLTVVEDGEDSFVVGDSESGTFINVPAVGALVIRELQGGATVAEATGVAEAYAGEPVDVPAFLDALSEVGFLAEETAGSSGGPEGSEGPGDGPPADRPVPHRTAPIQQRRWLIRPDRRWVSALFSPAAWAVYAAAAVFSACCLALRPSLFPSPHDAFVTGAPGPGMLLLIPLTYGMTALHEYWHWLAARAAGLGARFGVDRRLVFLVFETDLSQLWTLPRRKRYGPQLAGLAIESVILAALLVFRLCAAGHPGIPRPADHLAAALVMATVMTCVWQCLIFLRTDLYSVLLTWTGCYNLWETQRLLLRRAFGRLSPEQAERLAAAHPRDLSVGRWFRWLYLGGLPLAIWFYAHFTGRIMLTTGEWAAHGLATDPLRLRFWTTLVTAGLLFVSPILVAVTWCLTWLRRRTSTPA